MKNKLVFLATMMAMASSNMEDSAYLRGGTNQRSVDHSTRFTCKSCLYLDRASGFCSKKASYRKPKYKACGNFDKLKTK